MLIHRNSVHFKWTIVLSLCLSCFAEPELSGWLKDDDVNFPKFDVTDKEQNIEYWIGRASRASGQEHPIFQKELFNDVNIVSNIDMSYDLWIQKDHPVQRKDESFINPESDNKFKSDKSSKPVEFFREYIFQAIGTFQYGIRNLKAQFMEENAFDGKFEPKSETHFATIPLEDNNCFSLPKMEPKDPQSLVNDPEKKKEFNDLVKKHFQLYIGLGDSNANGFIHIDHWKPTEDPKQRCLYDYFLLNTGKTQLIITSKNETVIAAQSILKEIGTPTLRKSPVPEINLPDGKIDSKKWYYFNPIYAYSIVPATDAPKVEVSICDVAANCVPYEWTTENHSPVLKLNDNLRKLLGNTPFVRFHFSENPPGDTTDKFSFPEKFIENAIRSDIFSKTIEATRNAKHLSKSQPITVTIPMNKVDPRFVQVKAVLECDAEVRMKSMNFAGKEIDLSFLKSTKKISVNTGDFFFADKTDVHVLSDMNITLETITESPNEVKCKFIKVDPGTDIKIELKEPATVTSFNHPQGLVNLKSGKNVIVSSWIRRRSDIPLRDSTIKVELSLKSNYPLDSNTLSVKRFIVSQDFFDVQDISPAVSIDDKILTVKDEGQNYPTDLYSSAVRIGYSIELPEKIQYEKIIPATGSDPERREPAEEAAVYTDPKLTFIVEKYPDEDFRGKTCFENSLAHIDCKFEKSKCLGTFKEDNNQCLMEKYYSKRIVNCEGNTCSNILKQPIAKRSFTIPAKTATDPNPTFLHLGRYYPLTLSKENDPIFIRFPVDVQPGKDYCITLKYSNSQGNFSMKFDGANSETHLVGTNTQGQELCVSHYTPHPENVKNITIEFVDEKDIQIIDDHYIEKVSEDNAKQLKVEDYQILTPVFYGSTISPFLESNAFDKFTGEKTLTTKWIKNENSKVRLGFKAEIEDDNKKAYVVYSAVLIDDQFTHIEIDSGNISGFHFLEHTLASETNFYKIQLNFKTVPKPTNGATTVEPTKVTVTKDSLFINDPCQTETGSMGFCVAENTAKYIRKDYSNCECGCKDGYSSNQCQTRDFCWNKPCAKGECENHEEYLGYICKNGCKDDEIWDINNEFCIKKKDDCPENEMLVADGLNIKCDCKEGFIRINGTCVQFDVCNNEHRKSIQKFSTSCPKNSHCQATGTPDHVHADEYECVCNDDYFNAKGIFSPGKVQCLVANVTLNVLACDHGYERQTYKCKCAQGYEMKEGVCQPEESRKEAIDKIIQDQKCESADQPKPYVDIITRKCVCQTNFQWNKEKSVCEVVKGAFKNELGCEDVHFVDGKLACVCDDTKNEKLDPSTRTCKVDYQQDILQCKNRNGKWNEKNNVCDCLENEIKFLAPAKSDWTCVDRCVLLGILEKIDVDDKKFKCSTAFSYCDPKKIKVGFNQEHATEVWTNDKIFDAANNTIVSVNDVGGMNPHCFCEQGFDMDGSECIQKQDSGLVTVKMTLKAGSTQTREKFAKKYEILIKKIFMLVENPRVKCDEIVNGDISCEATFAGKNFGSVQINEKTMRDLIVNKALKIDNDILGFVILEERRDVFFITNGGTNIGPTQTTELIQFYTKLVEPTKIDLCKDNPCDSDTYKNTVCGTIAETNIVECRCPDKFFEVKKTKKRTIGGHEAVFESCKEKDICGDKEYGCADTNAQCTTINFHNGTKLTLDVLCTCDNGIRLVSKTAHCDDCDACNHEGTMLCGFKDHGVCKCYDGWTGEKCDVKTTSDNTKNKDTEKDDEKGVSKAFLYTTIVLGIVAAIAIVAVAIMFFQRR